MANLLLEIGVEEIPDSMIPGALRSLHDGFAAQLGGLNGTIELLDGTPRRLAMLVSGLSDKLPDANVLVTGPYVSAGAKAAEGFARKNGTTVEQLQRDQDAKGERYVYATTKIGEPALPLLQRALPEIVQKIAWPKSMVWTGAGGMRFIRPLRWCVALLDDQVIPFALADVQTGNTTRGHRILGSPEPLPVTFANYVHVLRENGVILPSAERRSRIESQLGADVLPDDGLLQILVYLTEWPSVIRGSFDAAYLTLPREVLSTVMRHHQRQFSVLRTGGDGLAPHFVAVTNTDGDPDGLIRAGNERVLRARFNDARFFWDHDQTRPLSERVTDLSKVTWQAKLGSYRDKTDRVVALAGEIAQALQVDVSTVQRAALLAKCDLTTDMVKEFTDLQGIVGGLYAAAQGESDAVSTAIYDQYKPVSMDDSIPRTIEGQILSLADRLDTLRECFRIGLIPTGSKDPFALRRAAQGVVKICIEGPVHLPLSSFVPADLPALTSFLSERVQFYLRDVTGFAYDEVNAVLATPVTTLPDLLQRVQAVHSVRPTADFEPLAASFKRIKNILKQAGVTETGLPRVELLAPGPELELFQAFERARSSTHVAASYDEKLVAIASVRPQVDRFFDAVLVNDPQDAVRANRLALLASLLREFSTIADFSEIVTGGSEGI